MSINPEPKEPPALQPHVRNTRERERERERKRERKKERKKERNITANNLVHSGKYFVRHKTNRKCEKGTSETIEFAAVRIDLHPYIYTNNHLTQKWPTPGLQGNSVDIEKPTK